MVEKKCDAVHKLEESLICKCFTPSTKAYLGEEKAELGVTEPSMEDQELLLEQTEPGHSEEIVAQQDQSEKPIYLAWYGIANGNPLTKVIPFQNIEAVQAFFTKFEESCNLTGTKPSDQCRYYIQAFGDYKCQPEPIYPFPAAKKESTKKKASNGKGKKCWSDDDSD